MRGAPIEAIEFRGGPLNGQQQDRSGPGNLALGMQFDRAPYVPVDEFTDREGVRWLVLGHDPTGELTEHAGRGPSSPQLAGLPHMLEFRGGPAHGRREPAPPEGFHPELFRIDAQGAAYARTPEHSVDNNGVRRTVFRYDPTGELTEVAQRLYAPPPS
jgi:hypothetical protein